MVKHTIAMCILYAGLIALYTECEKLKCKLTLKSVECELYKSILETAFPEDQKTKSKKGKA